MGMAFLGICIGLFLGSIISLCLYVEFYNYICDHFFKTEERKNMMRLNKIFVVALCLLITNAWSFGMVQMGKEKTSHYAEQYLATKTTIESSVKNENLSGFERVELVKQASEENAELARVQYKCKQWYGFDIDKRVLELEPIEL